MNKSISARLIRRFIFVLCPLSFVLCLVSCDPAAHWESTNVEITMDVHTVSAGFIECAFSTDKEAYYLIAVERAREGYDPMEHQKQFMTLALDSADKEYISWRHNLLKEGEFNIAPFSSHALQYGSVEHFFTGLIPDNDYWVYAFVVNPDKMTPAGKLYLTKVTTTDESVVDVHFDYRVKGLWDYAYPLDAAGNIYTRFPYLATTRDSVELRQEIEQGGVPMSPQTYFKVWMLKLFMAPWDAHPLYGVQAVKNDGIDSYLMFEEGHTYYTAIGGFDGSFKQYTLYRFRWEGENTELYLSEEQNIADGEDW